MKIGTKSVLFGVHQFAIHPWFVALSWYKLYGFPKDHRIWVSFFVHDLGYLGKPNMDGVEGEEHPELGAKLMHKWFDKGNNWLATQDETPNDLWRPRTKIMSSTYWWRFTRYHSRFLAKRDGQQYSPLCVADKLAIALTPRWLYLIQSHLTGEIHEYMQGKAARTPSIGRTKWQWLTDVQDYCRAWAYEHKNGKLDYWTGTKRDLANKA